MSKHKSDERDDPRGRLKLITKGLYALAAFYAIVSVPMGFYYGIPIGTVFASLAVGIIVAAVSSRGIGVFVSDSIDRMNKLQVAVDELTKKVDTLAGESDKLTKKVDTLAGESDKLTKKTGELTTKVSKLTATTKAEFRKLSAILRKRERK